MHVRIVHRPMGLVDYADSDSESDNHTSVEVETKTAEDIPPAKRYVRLLPILADDSRKLLPPVPSNYLVDPKDDAALHQGRTRSRPYTPGELNAHIYLSRKIACPRARPSELNNSEGS